MQFNCQPVEKKNHWQSQAFHRGSQKGGRNSKYTVQVSTSEQKVCTEKMQVTHGILRSMYGILHSIKVLHNLCSRNATW